MNGLFAEQKSGEEPDERFLNPGRPEINDDEEKQQMDGCHDEKSTRQPRIGWKPEGKGEEEEQQDRDDDEEKHDCQGSRRQQANHLVNHVELNVFRLQPEIMFKHLDQLRDRLNTLVAG